ncbi:hypothetical protein CRUP_018883 [Coryphaenoides rupestris]|nr:hypothetical protein CRUP_018883 [Coryphaenoides rupestris]
MVSGLSPPQWLMTVLLQARRSSGRSSPQCLACTALAVPLSSDCVHCTTRVCLEHWDQLFSAHSRTAVTVIGEEISGMQRLGQLCLSGWMGGKGRRYTGQEAMRAALASLEDTEGWKAEIAEVFRLEAVLEASVEELYDILFARVEEMHHWNPGVQHIKVLERIGPETMVTHEVSAETAGNLIGQRDFLSVRHSCKHKSCIYVAGAPAHLEEGPPPQGFVRAV